jgi:hypothetical protein
VRSIRRLHLYLGCFFSPLLLFYIGTGWYQTLNTNRNKGLGEQGNWISSLTSVHVDQVYPTTNPEVISYSPFLFRGLVILMSISLIVTIGLGIFLAFRTTRRHWPVWLSLLLGIVVPALFLWFGQRR